MDNQVTSSGRPSKFLVCLYLEYINIHVQRLVLATDLWLSIDNFISIFGCPANFFGGLGLTDNQILNAADYTQKLKSIEICVIFV